MGGSPQTDPLGGAGNGGLNGYPSLKVCGKRLWLEFLNWCNCDFPRLLDWAGLGIRLRDFPKELTT